MSPSLKSVPAAASAVLALALLAACGRDPKRAPAIGEAYVGPYSLKLRADIPLQAPVVATVKHGDRLEIIQKRRRFLKARTSTGAEGWIDDRQLLAASDMAELRELSRQAREMLAQGQAGTFGDLNVHTQPSRQSPSFIQIKEGDKVDVLLHSLFPRAGKPRAPILPPTPKKQKAVAKKPPKEPKVPPPPMPRPPGLPPDWQEISKTPRDPDAAPEEIEERPPAPTDRWSLVRLANGASGWVLTGRLMMAIPDEVAQYAEGKRIVSYFPLGEPQGAEKKQHWLWTTAGDGRASHDFDSFRVFIWNVRRGRYETAYIERNLRGYAPVLLRQVELSAGRGVAAARYPGFSICMEKKDGQRVRREFAFTGAVVRYAGEYACEAAPAPLSGRATAAGAVAAKPAPPPEEARLTRWKRGLQSALGRLLGR